jgi:starvation-inducible outer membrane lipoprotein
MEAMLGISLYSYPLSQLAKTLSFLLLLMSSLQQNWSKGQNRFCQEARWGGEVAQTAYANMNKGIKKDKK